MIYLGFLPCFRYHRFILWLIGFTTVYGKMFGGVSFVLVLVMKKMQSFGSSEGTADLVLEIGNWFATYPRDDVGDQGY